MTLRAGEDGAATVRARDARAADGRRIASPAAATSTSRRPDRGQPACACRTCPVLCPRGNGRSPGRRAEADGHGHRPSARPRSVLEGTALRRPRSRGPTRPAMSPSHSTRALGEGPLAFEPMGQRPHDGLALDGQRWRTGVSRSKLDGELPAPGDAVVRELSVRSSLGEMTGQARIDRARLSGTGRLDASVPELKAVMLALAQDLPFAGIGEPRRGRRAGRSGQTDRGGSRWPSHRPERPATGRAGTGRDRTRAFGPGRRGAGGREALQSLQVVGAGVRLGGRAVAIAWRTVPSAARLRLAVPELARLEPAVGQPIAGAAICTAGSAAISTSPCSPWTRTIDRLASPASASTG